MMTQYGPVIVTHAHNRRDTQKPKRVYAYAGDTTDRVLSHSQHRTTTLTFQLPSGSVL